RGELTRTPLETVEPSVNQLPIYFERDPAARMAFMLKERPLDPFVKESPAPEDVGDPRLTQLLKHWNGLAAEGPPSTSAIDPMQLRFILGWLMLMQPLDGGSDFRYRLYGSGIAATTGRDLTGANVSDSFPAFAAWTTEIYRSVMAR